MHISGEAYLLSIEKWGGAGDISTGEEVQQNPAYLTVIVPSRVITKLSGLTLTNTQTIENLYASDLDANVF